MTILPPARQRTGYILAVTGGTDSVGDAEYNYQLSQRRADAVVNYLATKYNIPPHKFYLIGIGKDQQVATIHRDGRAKNRRVEIKLMTQHERSADDCFGATERSVIFQALQQKLLHKSNHKQRVRNATDALLPSPVAAGSICTPRQPVLAVFRS